MLNVGLSVHPPKKSTLIVYFTKPAADCGASSFLIETRTKPTMTLSPSSTWSLWSIITGRETKLVVFLTLSQHVCFDPPSAMCMHLTPQTSCYTTLSSQRLPAFFPVLCCCKTRLIRYHLWDRRTFQLWVILDSSEFWDFPSSRLPPPDLLNQIQLEEEEGSVWE